MRALWESQQVCNYMRYSELLMKPIIACIIVFTSCRTITLEQLPSVYEDEKRYPFSITELEAEIKSLNRVFYYDDSIERRLKSRVRDGFLNGTDSHSKFAAKNLKTDIHINMSSHDLWKYPFFLAFYAATLFLYPVVLEQEFLVHYELKSGNETLYSKEIKHRTSYSAVNFLNFLLYLNYPTEKEHKEILFRYFGQMTQNDISNFIVSECFLPNKKRPSFCNSVKILE